jgi:hypothetical protein
MNNEQAPTRVYSEVEDASVDKLFEMALAAAASGKYDVLDEIAAEYERRSPRGENGGRRPIANLEPARQDTLKKLGEILENPKQEIKADGTN